MTRLLLSIAALAVAASLSVVLWQLPASIRASQLQAYEAEAVVDAKARDELARGTAPTRLASRDFLLAQASGSGFVLISATRERHTAGLLPWQIARQHFGLDAKLPPPDWSSVRSGFYIAFLKFGIAAALSSACFAACVLLAVGSRKDVAGNLAPVLGRATAGVLVLMPVCAMLIGYRDYDRRFFYLSPAPEASSLALLLVLLLPACMLLGTQYGLRVREQMRQRQNRCLVCGYDMASPPGTIAIDRRCAECGTTVAAASSRRDWARYRALYTVGWVLAVVLVTLWPMLATLATHAPTPGFPARQDFVVRWLGMRFTNAMDLAGTPQLVGEVLLPGMTLAPPAP